jgi:hypothetical protein
MNDTQIGLKNLVAYMELEYWLHTLNVQGMEFIPPKSHFLKEVLISIINNEKNIRSLSLEDLINYSKSSPTPILTNYIENIIGVKDKITHENIKEHESYLNTQIIYAHYFNRNLYSLDLKSSTTSMKIRNIQKNIFEKIFNNEEIEINELSKFEMTRKWKIFKKVFFKSTRIIGGPKECAEYIKKRA